MDHQQSQSRWIYAILAFGLIECILIALVLIEPAPANATGIAHPSIPTMRIGGDSTRFDFISGYAWWFQVFVLAQAHCLAALGVKPERRTNLFLGLLAVCYGVALFTWWQIVASYEAFVASGETKYFLGFPTATAWQTFGLFFSGCSLIALYSFGFRHFVWSDEDEQHFNVLLAQQKLSGEEQS